MNAFGADVCAVVVTYHPDDEVLANLRAVRPQVGDLVVVDNGSSADELEALRLVVLELDGRLLENGENLGIATALNLGVRMAASAGSTAFVLLLDQDSCVTEGYVETILECFRASEFGERLAIVVPRYLDRRFGHVLAPPVGEGGTLEAATTSGSLMPIAVFAQAGWFADEMFIDGVDYEYSLRVRRLGMVIVECVEAVLLHSPGTPTYHKLPGLPRFQVANYSPVRRYYQERNKVWVSKRYWSDFRGFCVGQFVISLKDLAKIVLVEDDKATKCRYFFRGLADGVRGVTGKMPPP